jgi:hypothetical protein
MQYHNPKVNPPEHDIGTWLLVLILFLGGGWGALWSIGHLVMWVLGIELPGFLPALGQFCESRLSE